MKKGLFLILAISLLVVPSFGYTVLSDYIVNNSTTSAAISNVGFNSTSGRYDFQNNITKIDWSGYCFANDYGSMNGFTSNPNFFFGTSSSTYNANVTLTYSGTGGIYRNSTTCQITIEFLNNVAISTPSGTIYHLSNRTAWFPSGLLLYYADPSTWRPKINEADLKGASPIYGGHYITYGGTAAPDPVSADFIGTPRNGTAPLVVSFTDNSTPSSIDSWNWSSTPSAGVSWSSTTGRNATAWFNINGNYTITHGAADSYTSDIETKTDYIQVYNSSEMSTTYVTAINALTSYPIHGAQVDLQDIENNSWSNTTTTDGTGSINTLAGHHINGYASAAGFDSNDKLNFPAGSWESILLFAPGLRNVSAGNVTLYVYVYDGSDHSKAIKGAQVTVVSSTTSAMGGTTNDGGVATFAVPNQTTVLIDVRALGQGYQGATQSVNTGTGSGGSASVTATFYLTKNTVTPTAVITTLPGGGTPTPTTTILPGCEDPTSPECQASQNNASMSWLSANAMWLIQLCVVMTALYIVGWKP